MYQMKIESFNGSVKTITLPNRETVESFLTIFPKTLSYGSSVKISCDLLGIRGTLTGKKAL